MPARMVSLNTDLTSEEAKRLQEVAFEATPGLPDDYVYMVHNFDTDDWHGTGTPYRTLAAAVVGASAEHYNYNDWCDAHEIYESDWFRRSGAYRISQPPQTMWFPLTQDDERLTPHQFGEGHVYIEKAKLQ